MKNKKIYISPEMYALELTVVDVIASSSLTKQSTGDGTSIDFQSYFID